MSVLIDLGAQLNIQRVLIAARAPAQTVANVGLGAMRVASRRPALLNGYRHPWALTAAGAVVALVMAVMGIYTLVTQIPILLQ
jgi:Mn2+/Fe2+ NRAMP family transporter